MAERDPMVSFRAPDVHIRLIDREAGRRGISRSRFLREAAMQEVVEGLSETREREELAES